MAPARWCATVLCSSGAGPTRQVSPAYLRGGQVPEANTYLVGTYLVPIMRCTRPHPPATTGTSSVPNLAWLRRQVFLGYLAPLQPEAHSVFYPDIYPPPAFFLALPCLATLVAGRWSGFSLLAVLAPPPPSSRPILPNQHFTPAFAARDCKCQSASLPAASCQSAVRLSEGPSCARP